MKQYQELLKYIIENGVDKQDRTGTGTRSVFGYQMRFDLSKDFPLITTKRVNIKAIIYELLWFLRGDTNIKFLVDNDVKIWNEWAFQVYLEKNDLHKKLARYSEEWQQKLQEFVGEIKNNQEFASQYGELGPIYGRQWRRWLGSDGKEIDQVQEALSLIKNDPTSRRIIICGWNVAEILALIKDHNHAPPPCHTLFQFMVINGKLSCQLYQRSADVFLGVPFNIASYALLTIMVAQVTGLQPGEFIHTLGDAHIYSNHFGQVKEQLLREPKALPAMRLNTQINDLFSFGFEDFTLENYEFWPAIKAPIAV